MIERGDRLTYGGQVVEVLTVLSQLPDRADLILRGPSGLEQVTLSNDEIAAARQPGNDGAGSSAGAVAGLWGKWMEWATPGLAGPKYDGERFTTCS